MYAALQWRKEHLPYINAIHHRASTNIVQCGTVASIGANKLGWWISGQEQHFANIFNGEYAVIVSKKKK